LTRVATPRGAEPSKKLTVPVGAGPVEVRIAEKMAGLSRRAGLAELVRATVARLRTVCERGAEVPGVVFGSPE